MASDLAAAMNICQLGLGCSIAEYDNSTNPMQLLKFG